MFPLRKDEFSQIVTGLLKKTKERKIPWRRDDAPNDAFRFSSPEFSLFLIRESPRAEPDYIKLEFTGPKGEQAGKWKVWEGDEDWPLAEELYAEVYRSVHGSDRVFDGVKRFIESV